MTRDILNPSPFLKPVLAKNGNSTAQVIYTAVGLALDRWEHCGTSFGILYSSLIETKGGGGYVLMRSFGVITAASQQQEMIQYANDACFSTHKNDDLKKQVKGLLKLHHQASSRRNNIAHAMVMGNVPTKIVDNCHVPQSTIWFLVPPLFATKKNEMHMTGPKYRNSTHELSHFTTCFEELGSRASKLAQAIHVFRSSLLEAP